MADLQQARAAKERLRNEFRERSGVSGIGLTADEDGYAVQVNVQRRNDAAMLPKSVDGVRVQVRVVGTVSAQQRPTQLRTV